MVDRVHKAKTWKTFFFFPLVALVRSFSSCKVFLFLSVLLVGVFRWACGLGLCISRQQ